MDDFETAEARVDAALAGLHEAVEDVRAVLDRVKDALSVERAFSAEIYDRLAFFTNAAEAFEIEKPLRARGECPE